MITVILWLSLYLLLSNMNIMQEALLESDRAKFQRAFQVAAMSGLVAACAVVCLMQGYK